jgi:hypothetical protein
MSSRSDERRGSISAFVVCVTLGLVFLGLLLSDSGRVVSEYVHISDVAGSAARLGAQSVVGIRAGNPLLDTRAAVNSARTYLESHDVHARVSVTNGEVIVDADAVVPMNALRMLGVSARRIHTVHSARLVSG